MKQKTIIEQISEDYEVGKYVPRQTLRLVFKKIEKLNRGSLLHPYLEIKRSDYLELKKQEGIR
jgi:hypothetical protein